MELLVAVWCLNRKDNLEYHFYDDVPFAFTYTSDNILKITELNLDTDEKKLNSPLYDFLSEYKNRNRLYDRIVYVFQDISNRLFEVKKDMPRDKNDNLQVFVDDFDSFKNVNYSQQGTIEYLEPFSNDAYLKMMAYLKLNKL